MKETTRTSYEVFDVLCDNTLAHMLCFLDFKSAMILSRLVSNPLRRRMLQSHNDGSENQTESQNFQHVWCSIFTRHGFASMEEESAETPVDFAEACLQRRKLFLNLTGMKPNYKDKKSRSQCFNLPHRYFHFVPVTPPEDEEYSVWEDMAPPVDFGCASFILTSPGVSGEMLFLDPFVGSLTIQGSCKDNAVSSSDFLMKGAEMVGASPALIQKSTDTGLDSEDTIADDNTYESVCQKYTTERRTILPAQVLLGMEEYHDIDLSDYFAMPKDKHRHGHADEMDAVLGEYDEVDIDYIGVDSKPVVGMNDRIVGTMVAIGRSLESCPESWGSHPLVCTEMICWKRASTVGDFDERLVCRLRGSYHCLEICPQLNRLYVVFPFGEGPFRKLDVEIQNDETDSINFDGGGRVVACYPLLDYPQRDDVTTKETGPRFFPKPLFIMRCSHSVSTVVVDPLGETLFVATISGTIEYWKTQAEPGAIRLGIMNAPQLYETAMNNRPNSSPMRAREVTNHMSPVSASPGDAAGQPTQESSARFLGSVLTADVGSLASTDIGNSVVHIIEENDDDDPSPPTFAFAKTITSIHHPPHKSLAKSGFVTLHHSHGESCILLLWKCQENDVFTICSKINLPLCARRKPRIRFDGRRLVVLGQDHVGMIILVYHVLSTWEDLEFFETTRDGDAGVENLTQPGRIRFVNRIRHASLGGLEYHDFTFMTCNERFVVVNTKSGNLLGGSSLTTDGLLVIDLSDYQE